MKVAANEREGVFCVLSNVHPLYDDEAQSELEYEEDECESNGCVIVFFTHSMKVELEEENENCVVLVKIVFISSVVIIHNQLSLIISCSESQYEYVSLEPSEVFRYDNVPRGSQSLP